LPMTKTWDLNVGVEASRGDINYNGLLAGFTVRF
jgi:hypothetical protein